MISGHTAHALALLLIRSNEGGGGDLIRHPYNRANPNETGRDGRKASLLIGSWAHDDIVIVGDYDSAEPHDPAFKCLYDEARKSYKNISADALALLVEEDIYTDEELDYMYRWLGGSTLLMDGREVRVDRERKKVVSIVKAQMKKRKIFKPEYEDGEKKREARRKARRDAGLPVYAKPGEY
jgi:hypothetical protein